MVLQAFCFLVTFCFKRKKRFDVLFTLCIPISPNQVSLIHTRGRNRAHFWLFSGTQNYMTFVSKMFELKPSCIGKKIYSRYKIRVIIRKNDRIYAIFGKIWRFYGNFHSLQILVWQWRHSESEQAILVESLCRDFGTFRYPVPAFG